MKSLAALFLGFVAGAILARTPPEHQPTYIPCAVPVFARQASTLEELEQQAALKMAAMRSCAHRMQLARKDR